MTADLGNDRVFVDTNILFYAMDLDSGTKRNLAKKVVERIWIARTGCLSTQVLSELIVNLRKKLNLPWEAITAIVRPYLTWQVISNDPMDTIEAIRIAKRNEISYWDGMIVQAAVKAHAVFLLTEDLNSGQIIEGVEVSNPFQG